MRKLLLAILPLTILASLHAQTPAVPASQPAAPKYEIREFRPSDFKEINLSMSDGTVDLFDGENEYTYRRTFQTNPENIAAAETLLSELRHASKVSITVDPHERGHFYSTAIVLHFDSLK
jgi:hypothetical protein